jgi:hypothetical protein
MVMPVNILMADGVDDDGENGGDDVDGDNALQESLI